MRDNWWKYAASAAAVLVLIVSGFFMLSKRPKEEKFVSNEVREVKTHDVPAPEAN